MKEVVKEEPEQQAVQEQPAVQEQDDGGWEAVPTKPKKGGKKTNQKNESNKGLFTKLSDKISVISLITLKCEYHVLVICYVIKSSSRSTEGQRRKIEEGRSRK